MDVRDRFWSTTRVSVYMRILGTRSTRSGAAASWAEKS